MPYNMILFRDGFRIGLVNSPRISVLSDAKPRVNTANQGLITRSIQKSSLNDIFIN